MIMANNSISPLEYIKPTIMAASLILRPVTADIIQKEISSFIGYYLADNDNENKFIIETKDTTLRIPYSSIYYFEAKEKKVFVRLQDKEYGYYDTLDNLIEKLPENFIRTHRGFIVNKDRIERLINVENLLALEDGFYVPISRSYKSIVKELIK